MNEGRALLVKLAILGCGDLGARCGQRLLAEGWQVHGLRRNPDRLPAGFVGHAADSGDVAGLHVLRQLRPDLLLITLTPAGPGLDGYRRGYAQAAHNLVQALGPHRPRHTLVVSSTRVYAERDGGWVDEGSPLAADDQRALALIEMERALPDAGIAASAIRFGGIYGAPQSRLLARVARGELSPAQPQRYSNRIHRDDCGAFLAHLLRQAAAGQALQAAYNGVDDEPAPQYEVEQWLADEMGLPTPGRRWREPATSHKRCRNRALHESGYSLLYPGYREGYRALLDLRRDGP